MWIIHAAGSTGHLSEILWKIGTSVPTEAPIFFIISFSAHMRITVRFRFHHQVISVLQFLEEQHYVSYSILGKNRLVKFSILDWKTENTILGYSYPCQKDSGFYFFPITKVHELISIGKCSEMDILLDLWIHAVYYVLHQ